MTVWEAAALVWQLHFTALVYLMVIHCQLIFSVFTMVILRRMVLYICSHQLTVLLRWQYNDYFVQPDLFLSLCPFFLHERCVSVCVWGGFFFLPLNNIKWTLILWAVILSLCCFCAFKYVNDCETEPNHWSYSEKYRQEGRTSLHWLIMKLASAP